MLLEVLFDLLVGGAGADELAEFFDADAGAVEEAAVHGAAVDEVALLADEGGAAFVEGAGGFFVAGKFFGGVARFGGAEVFGEFFDGFEVFHFGRFSLG